MLIQISLKIVYLKNINHPWFEVRSLRKIRLRVVPHFSSGIVERAKRERA